jgi:hypothetical protein
MPRRRSQTAAETEAQIQEALDGIRKGKFKSAYHAAKVLDLSPKNLRKRMAGVELRVITGCNRLTLVGTGGGFAISGVLNRYQVIVFI